MGLLIGTLKLPKYLVSFLSLGDSGALLECPLTGGGSGRFQVVPTGCSTFWHVTVVGLSVKTPGSKGMPRSDVS